MALWIMNLMFLTYSCRCKLLKLHSVSLCVTQVTEEDGSIEGLNPTMLAEEVCKLKDIHQTLYNFSVKKILNSDRTFTNNK